MNYSKTLNCLKFQVHSKVVDFDLQDLNCLIDWYLEPLKAETFLTGEDIEHLFGNIQEIVQFQKLFLQSLEEAVDQELGPITDSNESIQFKV